MSLLKYLDRKPSSGVGGPQGDFVALRRVPLQPPDVPADRIFMGTELGYLPISGSHKPRAGESAIVIGYPPDQIVLAPEPKDERNPIFTPSACQCRCTSTGLVYYLTFVQQTPNLIIIDAETGDAVYYSPLPEVLNGVGIAVNPKDPGQLYILDDRSIYDNLITDANPLLTDPNKNYFTLLEYQVSGSAYALASVNVLPSDQPEPKIDSDKGNCMRVIDGVVYFTLGIRPAAFMTWNGTDFTVTSLTLDGDPYQDILVGEIVKIKDRPARTGKFYVAAQAGAILEFDSTGVISTEFTDSQLFSPSLGGPRTLVTVCNRLYAYLGSGRSRVHDFSETGGGEET